MPDQNPQERTPVFHVTTYTEWLTNGRTHCCHQHVNDLPPGDETGSRWSMREPSHTKCGSTAVTT
jgi:hypothetical protein